MTEVSSYAQPLANPFAWACAISSCTCLSSMSKDRLAESSLPPTLHGADKNDRSGHICILYILPSSKNVR